MTQKNSQDDKIDIANLLTDEMSVIVANSRELIKLIESAKTSTKSMYYKKKLRKNNAYLARLLLIQEKRNALIKAASESTVASDTSSHTFEPRPVSVDTASNPLPTVVDSNGMM